MLPSLGDIEDVCKLIYTIYTALDDAQGSTKQYRTTRAELDSLLRILEHAVTAFPASTPAPISQDIMREVTACRALLEELNCSISKYHATLGPNAKASSRAWRRLLAKLLWMLCSRKDAAEFKTQLSAHRESLTMYLSVTTLRLLRGHNADTVSGLRHINTTVDEMSRALRETPPCIGYTSANAVTLIDGLGKTLTLPLELCYSWQKLHSTLMVHFSDKAGRRIVEQGSYDIFRDDGKTKIFPFEWKAAVVAGMTVEMSMIVRTWMNSACCPRCRCVGTGSPLTNGWLEWCAQQFEHTNPPFTFLLSVDAAKRSSEKARRIGSSRRTGLKIPRKQPSASQAILQTAR
ncbi:hypothetical protein FA95DRAFT_375942 [Auriscalpium vulgare]|uniref:Uncharacterized protein n=1 Tax=Auriscalpium vulgare TaxID=40419 RepID=A0ACB8RIL6_9AGAM|nr:hypothetical protein FA95DRAFT_375942 [Auriscalpium vulgare]